MNQTLPIIILTGPTASGKSQTALELATKIGGEIVNADSMQLYEYLPVLTACPSAADQVLVPHHLYQILGDHQISSAAWWVEMTHHKMADILSRGYIPLIVGGTGLYLQALTEGLSPIPEIPTHIREAARLLASQSPQDVFFAAVCEVDPAIAKILNPRDTQRLTRALEVMQTTGKSILEWQRVPREPGPYSFQKLMMIPDRQELYHRINQRFIQMVERGAIDEVEALSKRSIQLDSPILRAVGVKEIQGYLRGELSSSEMIEKGQQASRRYAKRQLTWLRTQAIGYQIFDSSNIIKGMVSTF